MVCIFCQSADLEAEETVDGISGQSIDIIQVSCLDCEAEYAMMVCNHQRIKLINRPSCLPVDR